MRDGQSAGTHSFLRPPPHPQPHSVQMCDFIFSQMFFKVKMQLNFVVVVGKQTKTFRTKCLHWYKMLASIVRGISKGYSLIKTLSVGSFQTARKEFDRERGHF